MEIKVEKVKQSYNKDFKGISIKCPDNTPLESCLNALREFEIKSPANTNYVAEAFDQKNVCIMLKAYTRYMPMGHVTLNTFTQYKNLINYLKK